MLGTMIVGSVLLAAAPPHAEGAGAPRVDNAAARHAAVRSPEAEGAALAEYNARREKTPQTADAQYQLGLWCEQKGLKAEAMVHFAAVLQRDPGRQAAWKHLGFKKHQGRWMTEAQVTAQKEEAEAQKKSDRHWEPLLRKWKSWLGTKGQHGEAETALAGVTDLRAVPSVWKVFGLGRAQDQLLAVQLLGQIPGATSSRTLALLAVFGKSAPVRQAAIGTLRQRDPLEFVDVLIALLRDPLKYEVRPVGVPGSPGALFVEGKRYNVQQVYAPPSLLDTQALGLGEMVASPAIPFGPGQSSAPPAGFTLMGFRNGVPLYMNSAEYKAIGNDAVAMNIYPHAAIPRIGAGAGGIAAPQPSPASALVANSPAVQFAQAALQQQMIADWTINEAQKMAVGAQMRLTDDVSRIEAANAAIRETNRRALQALKGSTGQAPGDGRKAWVAWWQKQKHGYETKPSTGSGEKPTLTVGVPLPYVPMTGPALLAPTGIPPMFCLVTNMVKNVEGKTHAVVLGASCFGAGTLVHTAAGLRPIETLREVDLVLSEDLTTGSVDAQPILSVHQGASLPTIRLRIGGETVTTTDSHPFYRPELGWTRAGNLRAGDRLESQGGAIGVTDVAPGEVCHVYNLRVAGGHTYLVGRGGLLVHDGSPVDQAASAAGVTPVGLVRSGLLR
jgi:hypothetical protein